MRIFTPTPTSISAKIARPAGRAALLILLVTAFLFALVPAGIPQQANNPIPPPSIPSVGPGPNQPDSGLRRMTERMARDRNSERQKEIVADTARLLKLAQELNADVSKSSKDTLSISVVKDAGEIEKLAKSIKEKMRDGD